jgi:6-pyruvoyltetrahydropterin/6-carboxytetrahydropterin synthase
MTAGRPIGFSTRTFAFSAGHRYWVQAWTAEENARAFGHLTVSHGHNYSLDVTIRGPIDDRTGMIMDLAELKRIVHDAVISRFEHADLNADPLFADRVPTTENIAVTVWGLLAPKLGADRLWRVRVGEDPTLYVDYFGPDLSAAPAGDPSPRLPA